MTRQEALGIRRQHQQLRANSPGAVPQRAVEILDVAQRQDLMRAIANAYGRLYEAAPDRFIWTGFAAIAITDGVAGACDVAIATTQLSRLCRLPRWLRGRIGADSPAARLAEDGVKAAFEANFAIFSDLYWVHLAYQDGGIELLSDLYRGGFLELPLLDAFVLIDEGSKDSVLEGNRRLFWREQFSIVTPIFDKYREALQAATALGLICLPNALLKESCQAFGGSVWWTHAFSKTSYGDFPSRWSWLESCGWAAVIRLHQDRRPGGGRGRLDREVSRAAKGGSESAYDRWRWNLRAGFERLQQLAVQPKGPMVHAAVH